LSIQQLSDDPWLEWTYRGKPDTIDLSEFMVITNVVSGCNDIIALFWQNKLGVDVDVCNNHFCVLILGVTLIYNQDNYCIINFEPDLLSGDAPLKTHLTLSDGPYRPSDRFLRIHFKRCIAVSACRGDVKDDYEEQEIEMFMEDLGIFDDEIDYSDPRWLTPLGMEVHSFLVRQRLAP
jgi:hypothetical protein